MKTTKSILIALIASVLSVGLLACGGVDDGDDGLSETDDAVYFAEVPEGIYGPESGKGCRVTSGTNKGHTGTYGQDSSGHWYCEGSWGATQCGGTPNKCDDK